MKQCLGFEKEHAEMNCERLKTEDTQTTKNPCHVVINCEDATLEKNFLAIINLPDEQDGNYTTFKEEDITPVNHLRMPLKEQNEDEQENDSKNCAANIATEKKDCGKRRRSANCDEQKEVLKRMSVRGLDVTPYEHIQDGVTYCLACVLNDGAYKTFKNRYSFQRHVYLLHEGTGTRKVFPCPVCKREYSRPDKMRLHKNAKHGKDEPDASADENNVNVANKRKKSSSTKRKSCTLDEQNSLGEQAKRLAMIDSILDDVQNSTVNGAEKIQIQQVVIIPGTKQSVTNHTITSNETKIDTKTSAAHNSQTFSDGTTMKMQLPVPNLVPISATAPYKIEMRLPLDIQSQNLKIISNQMVKPCQKQYVPIDVKSETNLNTNTVQQMSVNIQPKNNLHTTTTTQQLPSLETNSLNFPQQQQYVYSIPGLGNFDIQPTIIKNEDGTEFCIYSLNTTTIPQYNVVKNMQHQMNYQISANNNNPTYIKLETDSNLMQTPNKSENGMDFNSATTANSQLMQSVFSNTTTSIKSEPDSDIKQELEEFISVKNIETSSEPQYHTLTNVPQSFKIEADP